MAWDWDKLKNNYREEKNKDKKRKERIKNRKIVDRYILLSIILIIIFVYTSVKFIDHRTKEIVIEMVKEESLKTK